MHELAMEAVIFDMDGVIIDSEPFWKMAEFEIFSSLGVQLCPELCLQTQVMTTTEVTRFWYQKFPWTGKTLVEVENEVIKLVDCLIRKEGAEIKGAIHLIKTFKQMGYKIGLATNSPNCLISAVLERLNIASLFDAVSSSEQETKGKPDPAVYLTTARKLNVAPKNCIAFEDTYSGLIAAKTAGMKTIALVPEYDHNSIIMGLADQYITTFDRRDIFFSKFH